MSVEYSLDFRQELNASSSDLVPVYLLTFVHPATDEVLRLSTDRTEVLSYDPFVPGTKSRGNEYIHLPMSLIAPSDGEDQVPEFRIKITYLNEKLLSILRNIREPADVTIELVASVRPDDPEEVYTGFKTRAAPWESSVATLSIGDRDDTNELYPWLSMNPETAPGLFR